MIQEAVSIVTKDLKAWFRKPILFGMAILPLFMVLICMGTLVSKAESLPAGIILEDSDPLALEISKYIMEMESGTGLRWFEIEPSSPENVKTSFERGDILCYIVIPKELTTRLNAGEVVSLDVLVHNVNDDVTKNVRQRMEHVCNHFNQRLSVNDTVYYSPSIEFKTPVPTDVTFLNYLIASVLGLAVQLSSGVNSATTTAREFEDRTIKELVMGASLGSVVLGKVIAGIVQTLICLGAIWAFVSLAYGFKALGGIVSISLLILFGITSYASLGFLAAARLRRVIPAALLMILLNIVAWWIGGGLVPAEVWEGRTIGIFGKYLPQFYFYRSFTNLILTNTSKLLPYDTAITLAFGFFVFALAIILFTREAKRV